MKRLVSCSILVLITIRAVAQFGHEWIVPGQEYFKVSVAHRGVYRISFSDLQAAGFPVAADPVNFQIFHRGVQQSIVVRGASDHVFNASDYIEFIGSRNDGTLDASLYEQPGQQPHSLYNLYSDTTAYFLTVGNTPGKRIQAYAGITAGLEARTHHLSERLLLLTENYSGGVDYGNVQKTAFDNGEGWMSRPILQQQERVFAIDGISLLATTATKPVVEVLLTGRGPMDHEVVLTASGRQLATLAFNGYDSRYHRQEIEWSDIDGGGNFSLGVRVTGAGGADRVSVGYVRLVYPRSNTLSNLSEHILFIDPAGSEAVRIQLNDVAPNLRLFDITDPASAVQLTGEFGGNTDVVVPASADTRIVLASATAHSPGSVTPVVFRQINPGAQDYIIITHASLRRPAMGLVDPVEAYAEYRALPGGGGFDTMVVDIDQLYNQFNYGESSPRAVYQFMKFLGSAARPPDYLFLIGKGLDVNYGYHRNPDAFTVYKDLVPTAGYPAADMAFTASAAAPTPAVATGRLAANSPADVAAYLNKIRTHEALAFDALWRKKILHVSGGIEEFEPTLFRELMRDFAAVAEAVYLGGQVQAVSKETTDVQLVNIAKDVNEGLAMVTFFGHSAPNTLDFDIGRASDPVMGYDNGGKYPFLLMNGCDAGSFFLNSEILGEDWVTTPDKGAIGFIAHSSYGLVSSLHRYTSLFYEVAFADSLFMRKGVGMVQQEVARRFVSSAGVSPLVTSQLQQMVLLGDPALKLFGAAKPDYALNEDRITISTFGEERLTALADSFMIHIPVENYGVALDNNIRLRVTRQYGETTVVYDSLFAGTLFADTLTVVIRNDNQSGFGQNAFSIHVDADDAVDESNESNNIADFAYFIPLNGTRNLYPDDFAIVSSQEVSLSFQHTDALAGPRTFILEVDTTRTFESGYKRRFQLSADLLARQSIALLASDSLVYYWRTKIADPDEGENQEWVLSSFTYIADGREGWAQVRFPQFLDNPAEGLVKDGAAAEIRFEETVTDVEVKTFPASAGRAREAVSFKVDQVEYNLFTEGAGCRNNTLNLVAFDRHTTRPYAGIYFKWYELLYEYGGRRLLCGREPYVINSFTPEELVTGGGDDLQRYADNVSAGDSVVMFTIGNAGFSRWPDAAAQVLEGFGVSAAQLHLLNDGDAVIIFGRKGAPPGTAHIYQAASPGDSAEVSRTITGRSSSGSMYSTVIGPARRWDDFIADVSGDGASDMVDFTIVGIRADETMDTLRTGLTTDEDLSSIDASEYPWLKVVMTTTDEVELTAVQLEKWMVLFEPVPEGVIFHRGATSRQTVPEGEVVTADFGFLNIGGKSFSDSLVVSYNLLNHHAPGGAPESTRIAAPPPGDTTLFSLAFQTAFKSGLNDMEVFVNPKVEPERLYDNNWLVLAESVMAVADETRPVLEVTFDGRYLYQDEFVSKSPLIAVRLWDDNPYMLKRDTVGIRMLLAYPCPSDDCSFQQVFFSGAGVSWTPATAENDFAVRFRPDNLPEGRYRFRVEARDASGNESGVAPYEIAFRVEDDFRLADIAPFPNPFVERTRFEIKLTGSDAQPYRYDLHVADLQGREAARFSSAADDLHVGTNIIDWDGTAADGQRLPPGIYIYHLVISGAGGTREYDGKLVLSGEVP